MDRKWWQKAFKVKKSTIPRWVYLGVMRKICFYAPLVDILHHA